MNSDFEELGLEQNGMEPAPFDAIWEFRGEKERLREIKRMTVIAQEYGMVFDHRYVGPLCWILMKDASETVRDLAQRTLEQFREIDPTDLYGSGGDLTEKLIDLSNGSEFWGFRNGAILTLGRIGSERAVRGLIDLSRHQSKICRAESIRGLVEVGGPECVEALFRLATDSQWSVRKDAAKALGSEFLDEVTEEVRCLAKSERWQSREAAGYLLGEIGSEEAVDMLHGLLECTTADVRSGAAIGLYEALGDGSLEILLELSRREDDDAVLNNVGTLLGRFDDEEAQKISEEIKESVDLNEILRRVRRNRHRP